MTGSRDIVWPIAMLLLSACGPLRLGADRRVLDLSEIQLTQTCRLESRLQKLAGAPTADSFTATCATRLGDPPVQDSDPALASLRNLQQAEANARANIDAWEVAVAKQGRTNAAEQLDLMRRQVIAGDNATLGHQREQARTQAATKALHASAVALRKNQADLHRCFDLSVGQAWSQALRFNLEPITEQCAVEIDVLQKHIKALDKVRKDLASSATPAPASSPAAPGSPTPETP